MKIFESTDKISVTEVAGDHCALDFDGASVILSAEAVYDLAIRLASFAVRVADREDEIPDGERFLN